MAARLPGAHAEVTALQQAAQSGMTPASVAVTRAICPMCAAAIEEGGATLTSPTTVDLAMVTAMWKFDERTLAAELAQVTRPSRVAFAAACAGRLLPAYRCFSERTGKGDATELASILDRLWDDLAGRAMTEAEVKAAVDACMALVPQEGDEVWVEEQAAAEDAGAAVAYALRCRQNGEAMEAAWAGRRAYEALDHFVINRENIDTNQPGEERRVLAHPLVQAELGRQRRDLDELLGIADGRVADLAARLRERADREGATLFAAS